MAAKAVKFNPENRKYRNHLASLESGSKSYSARYETPLQRIAAGLDNIDVPFPESAAGNPINIESEKRSIRIVNKGLNKLPPTLKRIVMDKIKEVVGEAKDGTLIPIASGYESRKKIRDTSENLISNVIALLNNVKSGIKDNTHISEDNLKLIDKIFEQTIDDIRSK